MSAPIQNLRRLRWARRLGTYLPAAILPLGLVGLTVEPALDVRAADEELRRVSELVAEAGRRRAALRRFGDLAQLEEINEVRERLRALVPSRFSRVELAAHARFAADRYSVQLDSLKGDRVRDLELVIDGETVVMQELVLGGSAGLEAVLYMIAELRRHGLPTAVLQADFSRGDAARTTFDFQLRLGVFHYAPAAPVSEAVVEIPGHEGTE